MPGTVRAFLFAENFRGALWPRPSCSPGLRFRQNPSLKFTDRSLVPLFLAMSTVSIELELPFALRLPDGPYNCRLGADDFMIQLLRVGPASSTDEVTAKIRANPTSGEIQTSGLDQVAIPGVTALHTRLTVSFVHVSKETDQQVLAAQQRQIGRRFT